jgi:hypothetical protein
MAAVPNASTADAPQPFLVLLVRGVNQRYCRENHIPRIAMPVPHGNEFIVRKGMLVITLPGKLKHIFDDFGSLSRRDCVIRPFRSWWCSGK